MKATRRILPLLLLSLLAFPALASTATEIKVRATKRVEEAPAMGAGLLAWQQSSSPERSDTAVYARVGEDAPFRVHSKRTFGHMGAIDGTRLVYASYRGANREGELLGGDIRILDLTSRASVPVPDGINTRNEEFAPSLSGDWLLFARASGRKVVRGSLHLVNLTSGEERVLAEGSVYPGHVNGGFAVWWVCTRRVCNVFRHEIASGATVEVPNPNTELQYSAGVAADGTVYFFRSGFGCGTNPLFQKWSPSGGTQLLVDLPKGIDGGDAFVYEAEGSRQVLYTRFKCLQDKYEPPPSDLYKIVE